MSFGDIPEDLIEYILLQLTPYHDLPNCRLVSRQWYRLSTGALRRLNRLFQRADNFEWYVVQQTGRVKFVSQIAERCTHAACYHPNGSMFVFGGCTAAYTTFNDLWRFDLATRSWSRPTPMGTLPTPKACATMVEYKGSLFLFGGWSKSSPNPIHQTAMFFNELHVFNPVQSIWTDTSQSGPTLAGHSATVLDHRMIVFGGSLGGNCTSNDLWTFDIPSLTWSQPSIVSQTRPAPRYGQFQANLDDDHILIVGGCGGPNMLLNDVWRLKVPGRNAAAETMWVWEEVRVLNGEKGPHQLWSHPACMVGKSKLVVLSKLHNSGPLALSNRQPIATRRNSGPALSSSVASLTRATSATLHNVHQQTAKLVPPRRKLLSSKSLDEQETPAQDKAETVSPETGHSCAHKKFSELHRARSIPAIIVGEIPKLVVTREESESLQQSQDPSSSSAAQSSISDSQNCQRRTCVSMTASSLLPNQATRVADSAQKKDANVAVQEEEEGQQEPMHRHRPNANFDWQRQMDALDRYQRYINSKRPVPAPPADWRRTHSVSDDRTKPVETTSPSKPTPSFRFSSPPPKSNHVSFSILCSIWEMITFIEKG